MQRRIILLVVLSVLIILLSLGVIGHYIINDSIEHSLQQRLVLASIIGGSLDYTLEDNIVRLHDISLSGRVDLTDGDWGPERKALRTAYEYSIFTDGVFLTDREGQVMMTYPYRQEGNVSMMGIPYVQETIASRKPVISNVYETPLTKKKIIYVLVPLKSKDGEFIGVAGGEIDPANYMFTQLIKSIPLGEQTLVELIDSNGTIISSSLPERILMNSDHDKFLGNLIMKQKPIVGACHRCHLEQEAAPATGTAERTEDMLAFSPLSTAPWGISVREPMNIVFAPSITLRNIFMGLSLIFVFTAVVLSIGLSRSLLRPLQVIMASTRKIARGNLSEPLVLNSKSALGALAQSVEAMRKRLKESLDNIRDYNVRLEETVQDRTRELQKRKAQLSNLLDEVITAQEEERKRIARELHDETSQALAALGMSLDIATVALKDDKLTPAMIEEQRQKVAMLVGGIHRLIHDLRPPVLDDLGFESAVRWLMERHLDEQTIKFYNVGSDGGGKDGAYMDKNTELRLFRIVQEAVVNIARHSEARNVSVTFTSNNKEFLIDIIDDGKGFDVDSVFKEAKTHEGSGLGLQGIRERVWLMEGKINIFSKPFEGTHIAVSVPLRSTGGGSV